MASSKAADLSSQALCQGQIPTVVTAAFRASHNLELCSGLNPDAFVSTVDPSTGACLGGDSPAHCQFGNSRRNEFRGPLFLWSNMYLTKRIPVSENLVMRVEAQFFNVFNHPNFGLPSLVLAGVPGNFSTQTGYFEPKYEEFKPRGRSGASRMRSPRRSRNWIPFLSSRPRRSWANS